MSPALEDAARWLNNCTNWQGLSSIGQERIVRSSFLWLIVVPLLAKCLAKFASEYTIHILGSSFTITVDLPQVSAGRFSISVPLPLPLPRPFMPCFVPTIIKDYKDYDAFRRQDGLSQVLLKMPLVAHAKTRGLREVTAFIGQFCKLRGERTNVTSDTLVNDYDIKDDCFADAFHFVRATVVAIVTPGHVICAFLYVVGFALLLWVFADTFLFVLRFTASRL